MGEWDEQSSAKGNVAEADGNVSSLPDMDALFEQAVNMDDVRRTQEDALRPPGSYITVPVLSVQASKVVEGPNAGRLLFRFFGPAVLTVTEKNAKALKLDVGAEVRGQFGFAVSPERANKIKDNVRTDEPDNASKLWAQMVEAYKHVYQAKPGTFGDVLRYVQNYPGVIRVIQVGVQRVDKDGNPDGPEPTGEPGNIVMAFSPVREKRG